MLVLARIECLLSVISSILIDELVSLPEKSVVYLMDGANDISFFLFEFVVRFHQSA
jgi:hypothetical protein